MLSLSAFELYSRWVPLVIKFFIPDQTTHNSSYTACKQLFIASLFLTDFFWQIPLVSRQDLLETTTGNIFDLISNDVQRIEQAPVPFTSLLFKTPLELIAVVCLLLYLIGWQPLMGVLFILMLIPVCMIISYFCAKLRKKTAKVTDRRISQMSEVVCGIRALKAHAWEENYKDKVQEVRR